MGKHTACSLKTSVQNALLLPKRTVKYDFLRACMNGLVKKDDYTKELNFTKYNKMHTYLILI